jgi:hypothetical protein
VGDDRSSDIFDESILETLLSMPEQSKSFKSPWSDKNIREKNV